MMSDSSVSNSISNSSASTICASVPARHCNQPISVLRLPLGRGDRRFGSLVLVSQQEARFTEEHAARLELVAELVALALAHEKLARAWRDRRRRRDALERLLPTLARSLDVRTVFEQVSDVAQAIIPHDYVSLGLLNEARDALQKWGNELNVILRSGPGQVATPALE